MTEIRKIVPAPEYQQVFADELRRVLNEGAKGADAEREQRRARLARLDVEIDRYVEAIANGIASATLKERLTAAESERAQLRAEDLETPRVRKIVEFLPSFTARFEKVVGDIADLSRILQKNVVEAREELRGYLGGGVTMIPRKGGGIIAEARLDGAALMQKVLGNQRNICVVAGAGFEPATFGL